MGNENSGQIWIQQIRGPFLILSVVLVLVGISSAYRLGYVHWGHSALLIMGVILTHISVNLFNELSDYKTKIDEHTMRTPFSGGSGMLQSGRTTPNVVSKVAYGTLFLSAAIGVYFCIVSSWFILAFMILGGIAIRFYTTHLVKWLLGEFTSGMTLGSFVVLGSYMALTGDLTIDIVIISIPVGFLTSLLLLLNEFPDAEADKNGGRCHLVVYFGKKKSARIYVASLFLVYGLIVLAPVLSDVPYTVLIALFTLPIAFKVSSIVLKYNNDNLKLVPAQGMNVAIVILTDLLLAVGLFV
jgi:1,4-dihydroxy-2-naphthoate octaprenyltransferase